MLANAWIQKRKTKKLVEKRKQRSEDKRRWLVLTYLYKSGRALSLYQRLCHLSLVGHAWVVNHCTSLFVGVKVPDFSLLIVYSSPWRIPAFVSLKIQSVGVYVVYPWNVRFSLPSLCTFINISSNCKTAKTWRDLAKKIFKKCASQRKPSVADQWQPVANRPCVIICKSDINNAASNSEVF